MTVTDVIFVGTEEERAAFLLKFDRMCRAHRLKEAWSAAMAAHTAEGHDATVLRLASEGHPNARAWVVRQIEECDDRRCPCGADELCEGVVLADRGAYLAALVELLGVMDSEKEETNASSL